jgi:predicted permease
MRELLRRLSYLMGRRRFEDELDVEFQFHLDARADELEAKGMTRQAATAQARREFGPAATAGEQTRSAWQFRRIEDLASDLRYAARGFRRNPAFAVTAIACLALAIGVNTTIFSLTAEALFSQPSARDPESLMAIRLGGNSHAEQKVWRFLRDAAIFEGVAGENEEIETNWRHGDSSERLFAFRTTPNFFDVTRIPVAIGRAPSRSESAVVLSWNLWQSRFGGDPRVTGGNMILDGHVYEIAGVLPRDHRTLIGFGFSPDLYLNAADEKTSVALFVRLPAGMSRAEARARLASTAAQLDARLASSVSVTAISGLDRFGHDPEVMVVAGFFAMLLIGVGLVLLIACANVASMLLARASSRSHEIAIRLSIGAGRGRLVRQLLAESLLLAACGTIAGLAMNVGLTSLLSRIRLQLPIPIQYHIQPDWRLLVYSAAVGALTCIAAGLIPALQATRSVGAALHPGSRQIGGRSRLRNTLVVVQVAVSVVLLTSATLFLRNLAKASTMNPGFDLDHTVWALMRLVPESYPSTAKTGALVARALDELRGLPGVEAASIARVVPLNNNMQVGTELLPDGGSPVHVNFRMNYVGGDYFRAMRIPLLAGREFAPADRDAAVVNEAMARRLFGGSNPVGHTIRWGNRTIAVVGLARNSKYFTLGEDDQPAFYQPYLDVREQTLNFLVRASGRPEAVLQPLAAALGELDRSAAVEVKPMSQAMSFALLPSRAGAAILGSIGLLGLALAAIGLYGALLYSVSRRIREIGVRVALGASTGRILRMVAGQGAALSATGIAIGTAISVVAVRPLSMFLTPEVRTGDPSTFVMVAAALMAVSLVATAGPAIRALRVDPATALRHE